MASRIRPFTCSVKVVAGVVLGFTLSSSFFALSAFVGAGLMFAGNMSIIIGFIIGSVLGLTGAGGSIFAVPLLILLLNLAPSEAMGIGLGAVMASAMLGVSACSQL